MAVEETTDTVYLVLPGAPPIQDEGGEFSDVELEAVAGGWDTYRVHGYREYLGVLEAPER
jgi:hypothetical protein